MSRQARWRWCDAAELPRKQGIYALYDRTGTLVYIGSSSGNIKDRVQCHLRKPWGIQAIKVSIMRGSAYLREQKLIRRLRPKLNRRVNYNHLAFNLHN